MTEFEKAVKATMRQSIGLKQVTEEDARIYAHELLKAAIKQLREDGCMVTSPNGVSAISN